MGVGERKGWDFSRNQDEKDKAKEAKVYKSTDPSDIENRKKRKRNTIQCEPSCQSYRVG